MYLPYGISSAGEVSSTGIQNIRKAKRVSSRKFCEDIQESPACCRIHKVLAKDGLAQKDVGFKRKDDGTYIDTKKYGSIMVKAAAILTYCEESASQVLKPIRQKEYKWQLSTEKE